MNSYRTPEMSESIGEFCRSISPNSKPLYIQVTPVPYAEYSSCGTNVLKHIEEYGHGGTYEFGWIIWYRPNIVFEAEAHCIWIDTYGERHDITPHIENVDKIMYLPDNENVDLYLRSYNTWPPQRNQACTESPLVSEYLSLICKTVTAYHTKRKSGYEIEEAINAECTEAEKTRYHEIIKIFSKTVEPSKTCPCQSGLMFEMCCGCD